MALKDLIVLAAPVLMWLCLIIFFVVVIYCPLWISSLLAITLICFNEYYKCFAYRGLFLGNRNKNSQYISIITYNVNLAYKELSTQEKAERIAEYLINKDADIVALQEYNPQLFPILHQKLIVRYPYESPYKLADRYKAVYSKFPISDYVQLKSNCAYRKEDNEGEDKNYLPICGMLVDVGKNSFYMANCHLQSNNFSPTLRQYQRKELSVTNFIRMTLRQLSKGIRIREQQGKILNKHLKGCRRPLLICGDMNDVSGSTVLNVISGGLLHDAWWMKGFGFGYTLCAHRMRWRLDHILFSEGINIESIKVDIVDMSDHCPLLCKFYMS